MPRPDPTIAHARRGVVILATDTGVGKTFIGCALASALHRAGVLTRVRKPVETGCQLSDGHPAPADATLLWTAAGKVETLNTICPLRFTSPVAAPQAAAQEGLSLLFDRDFAPILRPVIETSTTTEHTYWIIESAGGALSPLAEDALNVQLAIFTQLPVVLIAPDRLGTLSTLFAHIEALARRTIPIAAIVLNQRPQRPDADNLTAVNAWLPSLLDNHSGFPMPPVISISQDAPPPTVGAQLLKALLE